MIAPGTMVATQETLSGREDGWGTVTAASRATTDKDTSMYLDDTPNRTTMTTFSNIPGSPAAMQIDRELTPLQQSEKEAMETSRSISLTLIRWLFAQDDDDEEEEDKDAAVFCTEYEREIYSHLKKLEVSDIWIVLAVYRGKFNFFKLKALHIQYWTKVLGHFWELVNNSVIQNIDTC